MPSIEEFSISGTASLAAGAGATPTVIGGFPVGPSNGVWCVTGKVIAVDTVEPPARGGSGSGIVFFPQFFFLSIAGVTTRLDTYANPGTGPLPNMPCQPEDRGLAGFGAAVPNPIALVTASSDQVQLEVTGISGQALTWAYALVMTKVSLP
jgi:hypothetical protein